MSVRIKSCGVQFSVGGRTSSCQKTLGCDLRVYNETPIVVGSRGKISLIGLECHRVCGGKLWFLEGVLNSEYVSSGYYQQPSWQSL